ncbi:MULTISPECIES: 2-polyprenyl-3-methyl-6-methoxy-1,4-benzoquinone monooxygenase [Candidatus Ichthyocystis]|uniref:3-demethoxyubiquinol 3-hydroxylase n=1 Tax=Candidatus Ichthyocystis hellenicum TaxID=1561003 RepID=A0A0S4M3E5_9BURK|nr:MULTISPECIES: 2-polyprenyl-3-methyl-6-methoxy-1,4-benzoquinone monooxygenase [Ichthyocystis]CUT17484.1 ubiquinone biosynthesis monooxygenase [Candidatus Ichthyocystis hellenicum]
MERLIISVDAFLRSMTGTVFSARPVPLPEGDVYPISDHQRKKSVSLLRINHVGEVCAQGLYQGQILSSVNLALQKQLFRAAVEEFDHLYWCLSRLRELDASPSKLLPIWYISSFLIGFFAGSCGDQWSLGFLEETEKQVVRHLEEHLEVLADEDPKSYAIFSVMKKEEQQHQNHANLSGARKLPTPIRNAMWFMSRVMAFVSPKI